MTYGGWRAYLAAGGGPSCGPLYNRDRRANIGTKPMSKTITVAIEGPGADRALGELLTIAGIQGNAQPVEPDEIERDGGVLVAIGAIVGIAEGIVSIVDQLIEWREKWQKADEAKRLSVVIEDANGNRLALDSATPEQITAVLETLAS
jgi:hypothetical protein